MQYLIDLGNTILACVQPRGEAERYIDTKLSEVEERWFNLVTQVCMGEGGRGEVWEEKDTCRHERNMLIQMWFIQSFVSSFALLRVMVHWTREKVPPIRRSLIGEPTRTCIVGRSPSSPKW